MTESLLGFIPVLAFLGILMLMDSYKLVSLRFVLRAVLAGSLAALACLLLSPFIMKTLDVSHAAYPRLAGPIVEEVAKALFVAWLIARRRVGFLVDAAICGFAAGAGFAVFENVYFRLALDSSGIALWIVRGFGTAMLHGSVTAIFAILSKGLSDRAPDSRLLVYLPGLVMAVALHALYNSFLLPPFLSTAVLLIVLPMIMAFIFQRSEASTRNWLGVGFDTDTELLELILGDGIGSTRVGEYLESLKSKFPGHVLGDMLCLLRIHLELSIRARGILLAREAGFDIPVDEEIRANFAELKFLEKSIGATGRLTLKPFLSRSSRDLSRVYALDR